MKTHLITATIFALFINLTFAGSLPEEDQIILLEIDECTECVLSAPAPQTQPVEKKDPFTPGDTFTQRKNITATHYPNGIAAIVDDYIITVDELQRKVMPFAAQIRRESTSEEQFLARIDKINKEILNRIIDDRLLIGKFLSNKKAKIPQSYLDLQYNKYIDEQFGGDRSQYNQYLKMQGISDRQFRQRQKEEVILAVVRNELRKMQSEISPDKIQKYYDSHPEKFQQEEALHLSQIMLTPPKDTADADIEQALQEKAKPVIEALKNGTPFADVAKQFSEDDMKSSGGDWGWINRDAIHETLANIAFSLKKNTFSDPIIFNNNAFILYVQDSKEKGLVPIDSVREQIEEIILNDLTMKEQEVQLEILRKKAHIKRFI